MIMIMMLATTMVMMTLQYDDVMIGQFCLLIAGLLAHR